MTSYKEWIAILRKTIEVHEDIPNYVKAYILTVLDKIEEQIDIELGASL